MKRWSYPDMTEDQLQDAVMDALERFGWTVTHHRRSDRAVTMGTPGEPDIRGVRDGRALWIECKSHRGRLTEWQAHWLSAYAQVPDSIVRVIRPDDLEGFLSELTRTSGALDPFARGTLGSELRRVELHTLTSGHRSMLGCRRRI